MAMPNPALIQALLHLLIAISITVASVRWLMVSGIQQLSDSLGWSAKAKGQLIGFATSLPELVVVLAAAWAGVFSAGFWNIAASNIINLVLFLSAVVVYLQQRELLNPRFIEELCFCSFSVILPVVLAFVDLHRSPALALVLIGTFIGYQMLNRVLATLKGKQGVEFRGNDDDAGAGRGGAGRGVFMALAGMLIVLGCGEALSSSTHELVQVFAIPAWAVGWLLGVVTSLPEMTSFFELYAISQRRGLLHELDDTQAGLDALVSSNMANIALIYPLGLLLALAVGRG
ncbi:MAG: hypothetical protein ERJ69_06875 [Aphanocapsa feldmannii 288cV]|nr:MAG: hypothetical protein ERJ69_06875 [Aphanocapsa feldmannii 288cV]